MTDPSLVILAGLIKTLREAPEVEAAFPGAVEVWELLPPANAEGATPYPFGRVGEIQIITDEAIENDDGTVDDPSEVFATLHAFARPGGAGGSPKAEAMGIIGAFRAVLGREDGLALEAGDDGETFRLVLSEIRDIRHFTDPDGLTAHSVCVARFEVEPAETT